MKTEKILVMSCLFIYIPLWSISSDDSKSAIDEEKTTRLYQKLAQESSQKPKMTFRSVTRDIDDTKKSVHNDHEAWLMQSSIQNAPPLLRGICNYLKKNVQAKHIPSRHRFMLVGAPGTGKTTLARAVAWHLNYPIHFVQATSLLGHFRNETSINIRNCFNKFMQDHRPVVVVIDELHKLFEHYTDSKTDHSESAAAFWQILDEFEKAAPHVIVIGTANTVDKLPPEIKSRFNGKIITMPLPSRDQQIKVFYDMIAHDNAVRLDTAINRAYIVSMLDQLHETSLRDVQLLIDTAKMFTYVDEGQCTDNGCVVLKREHFDQAIKQLKKESAVLKRSIFETIGPKIKNIGILLAIAVNSGVLAQMVVGSTAGIYTYFVRTAPLNRENHV